MTLIIPSSFFKRSTLSVAPELLSCFLVRKRGGEIERYRIVEVEAYLDAQDLASHAAKGRTARTEIMFGHPGVWYVYLVYGMHWMLNIVTEDKETAGAILIRGVEREISKGVWEPISGPGKVTRTLGIDKTFNGKNASMETGLWFEQDSTDLPSLTSRHIIRTPRIGVDYAGAWAEKKYRFVLKK